MSVDEVVDRTLVILKDLVGETPGLIEPTYHPIDRFRLSFYRNQVIHLFVEEALLCAVLYTRVKAGGAAPAQRMERSELLKELRFLSRLMQNEFVFATEGLFVNAERVSFLFHCNAAGRLVDETDQWSLHRSSHRSSPTASSASKEISLVSRRKNVRPDATITTFSVSSCGLSSKDVRPMSPSGISRAQWLTTRGMVHTDWLAAVSLFALTPASPPPELDKPVAWFAEKSFQSSAQLLAKTLFAQGDVSYLEAVNQGEL